MCEAFPSIVYCVMSTHSLTQIVSDHTHTIVMTLSLHLAKLLGMIHNYNALSKKLTVGDAMLIYRTPISKQNGMHVDE